MGAAENNLEMEGTLEIGMGKSPIMDHTILILFLVLPLFLIVLIQNLSSKSGFFYRDILVLWLFLTLLMLLTIFL